MRAVVKSPNGSFGRKKQQKKWSFLKLLLVFLNILSTAFTLYAGLSENPLLVQLTDRYGRIRQRFQDGSVNTDTTTTEAFRLDKLTPLEEIGKNFRFITSPRRDPTSVGEYHSVCTHVNTITAPVMAVMYDDFWGQGGRRVQINVHSISAPDCQILTVKTAWKNQCISDHNNNATLCHQYVLDNFEMLQQKRPILARTDKDFGERGIPFLKCRGRPRANFNFDADLVQHHTYWSGGDYHMLIQTSKCRAVALLGDGDRKVGLFEAEGRDEGADMILALPPPGWFSWIVAQAYSLVTMVMIMRGLVLALFHNRTVRYLPHGVRYGTGRYWLRYVAPFMPASIFFSDQSGSTITFHGSLLVASDIWMNHWLYMYLSIAEALTNIRLTYITYQVGCFMLNLKFTAESFIFICGGLAKITWIMCLVQTLLRMVLKLGARVLRAVRVIKAPTRAMLEWNIDGASIFLGYKLYNLLLCVILYVMMTTRGSATFMVRAVPYKPGFFGGIPEIAKFWGSEIVCDLCMLLATLTLFSQVIGIGLLFTKFRHVADNSVMRLLQRRYRISGWDGLLAAKMLGLDPSEPDFLVDGLACTKFSIGSLLQLLYLSGPSAFVHLAGDYIFYGGGFTKEPIKYRYPVATAMRLGMFATTRPGVGSAYSASSNDSVSPIQRLSVAHIPSKKDVRLQVVSLYERTLRVVTEGYLGKTFLIDAAKPPTVMTNKETGMRECEVVDALSTISILDIKYLLGDHKKMRSY